MPPAVLGLDVGGASLKAAHGAGQAISVPFALWQQPAALPAALRHLVGTFGPLDRLAVTMTGELCDCFESKRQGVCAILDAVASAAGGVPVRVWRNDSRFVDLAGARADPLPCAAANWLALATLAGRHAPEGPALLVDVGSTTTDVVPLLAGRPVPHGRTDPERLRCGELLYTGVRRTPVCALLGAHGAAELFATTLDVWLLLGILPANPSVRDTADGRPATPEAAHARLARMLCADLETSSPAERLALAERMADRQTALVAAVVERVAGTLPGPPRTVVLAGEGAFLAERAVWRAASLAGCRIIRLEDRIGPECSRAACAYAVAVLASEEEGG